MKALHEEKAKPRQQPRNNHKTPKIAGNIVLFWKKQREGLGAKLSKTNQAKIANKEYIQYKREVLGEMGLFGPHLILNLPKTKQKQTKKTKIEKGRVRWGGDLGAPHHPKPSKTQQHTTKI